LGRVAYTLKSLRALFGTFKSGDPAVRRTPPNHEIKFYSIALWLGHDGTMAHTTRQNMK